MTQAKFSFAVTSDTHYLNKDYHKSQIARGITDDLNRYDWVTRNVLGPFISEIRSFSPNFILLAGDFIEAGCDSESATVREMREGLSLLSSPEIPLFLIKGNHEPDDVYRKIIWPDLNEKLEKEVTANYYSFSYENSHFIIIDCEDFETDKQYLWLKNELEMHSREKNIFIFGHSPVFPVARPFFCELEFHRKILKLLQKYQADVYFCGHTHNQCLTRHKLNSQNEILQLKTAGTGFPDKHLNLQEWRTLLDYRGFPYDFLWGLLEDSAPGYFLVDVFEEKIRIAHYVFGKELCGAIEYTRNSQCRVSRPGHLTGSATDFAGIAQEDIEAAYLHLCIYNSTGKNKAVILNGTPIGNIPIGDSYSARKKITLPQSCFAKIKQENSLEIQNPEKESFTTGSFVLELVLKDERRILSTISPNIYTTTNKWDVWRLDILKYFSPGETIGPVQLNFKTEKKRNM
ncbi:MAG: metallophosphoesterase [Victivallaceae bacterium]|nr:metallophosphoesterase [Victivallaceae bacterium]